MIRSLAFCLMIMTGNAVFAADPTSIVYDFSATWCGPCQQMAPLVARLEREGLPIRKVDIDQEKTLANKFNITSIPTFVLVVEGKEVQRQSGAMSEADLRRMVAKIPSNNGPLVADNSKSPQVELGASGQLSQPQEMASTGSEESASNGGKSPLSRLLPFGRQSTSNEDLTVRGNDSELTHNSQQDVSPKQSTNPMDSSVRIRVTIDGKINLGSGTIIESREGLTKILTCAHIFRGINEDSKIEVDLMINQREESHIARLDSYDEKADLGLITVATTHPLPVAAIAMSVAAPKIGEPVLGIGCSGGDDPTPEELKVTAVDKYVGPHNIECTGLPVRGRSGGGLFNANGEVVGVCIAADREGNRGLYSGLLAVHALLEQGGLAHLYQPTASSGTLAKNDATSNANAPLAAASQVSSAVSDSAWSDALAANPPVASRPVEETRPAVHHQPVDLNAGSAEVVVIIRDPSNPNSQNRVVIIHAASQKFLSYLDGELDDRSMNSNEAFSRMESIPQMNRPMRTIAGATFIPPAPQPRDLNTRTPLELTTLSQPTIPHRYVRASGTSAQ